MMRPSVLLVLGVAACGGEGGEPISGTLAIDVGGEVTTPTVGAAIPDSGALLAIFGTREIDCDTTVQDNLERGVYLSFAIDPATLGAQMPFVSVIRVVPGGTHLNGGPGDLVIDAVDNRITGSVTFATTDVTDEGDIPITATGTFDVLSCI
jgi:hypothetical protein